MSWYLIKDYLSSFIGVFFIFIAIIFIPEIRKSVKYWIPLLLSAIFMLWLGWDKIDRDADKDVKNEKQITNLVNGIKDIKRNDSSIFSQIDSSLKLYKLQFKDGKVVPFNSTFIENSPTNVSSTNQKGGTTAGTINYK